MLTWERERERQSILIFSCAMALAARATIPGPVMFDPMAHYNGCRFYSNGIINGL
jgi:hypothetical protein